MSKILLSVIVCTYNRDYILSDCLLSLVKQTINKNTCEVIIVNNNSSDRTQEIAEEFCRNYENFRVIVEKNQGLSYSRNRGWKEARGKYVAYIDDDAKAMDIWCEKIIKTFETIKPEPVALGGDIYPFYEEAPPEWFTDEFEILTLGGNARFINPNKQLGFYGSNMAFMKDILEKYGGFSTDFGMVGDKKRFGEETEFFKRLTEKEKYLWYDPEIRVYHLTPVKNMKISYRFVKAFRKGQTQSIIKDHTLYSYFYSGEFSDFLIFLLLKIPYRLLLKKGNMKTKMVKIIEDIGSYTGYLKGIV